MVANFFHLSLNSVLWYMRILCLITPLITYPVTLKICRELMAVKGGGKRKTTNIVVRTTDGEYVATPAPAYVDDLPSHLDPIEVPKFITTSDEASADNGVRTVER